MLKKFIDYRIFLIIISLMTGYLIYSSMHTDTSFDSSRYDSHIDSLQVVVNGLGDSIQDLHKKEAIQESLISTSDSIIDSLKRSNTNIKNDFDREKGRVANLTDKDLKEFFIARYGSDTVISKKVAIDLVDGDEAKSLLINTTRELSEVERKLDIKDSIIELKNKEIGYSNDRYETVKSQLAKRTEEVVDLKKDLKKANRKVKFYRTTTILLTGGIAILLII